MTTTRAITELMTAASIQIWGVEPEEVIVLRPRDENEKMTLDDARWWADVLAENLMDAEYRVYADTETHFKLAAVRRLIERNEELEKALSVANEGREIIGRAIGAVL